MTNTRLSFKLSVQDQVSIHSVYQNKLLFTLPSVITSAYQSLAPNSVANRLS